MSETKIVSSRHAKAKKIPHSARTKVVFETLDDASKQGITTYDDLIDFVRETTGTGCSKRTICNWKKERATSSEVFATFASPQSPEPTVDDLHSVEATEEAAHAEPEPTVDDLHSALAITTPNEQPGANFLVRSATSELNSDLAPETCCDWEALPPKPRSRRQDAYATPGNDRIEAPPRLVRSARSELKALLFRTPLKRLLIPAAVIGVGLAVIGQALPSLSIRSTTVATANSSSTQATASNDGSINLPRQLKFSLSVLSPADLKVKQGDTIEAGQVLAERVEERDRLLAERNFLNLQFQQIQARQIPKPLTPVSVPAVQKLPPISYTEEQAAIRQAETNLRQAERAFEFGQQNLRSAPLEESSAVERAAVEVENKQRIVNNQKRVIDGVKLLKDLPSAVLPHEQAVLKSKEADLKIAHADHHQATAKLEAASRASIEKLQQLGAGVEKARSDLQVALAKLQTKKDQRAYQEYEASITAARRAEEQNQAQESFSRNLLEAEQQERDRHSQLSQLKAKINDVNNQMAALSVITSPYNGVVKAIKFQKQTNNTLNVELTLAVSNSIARSQ